MTHNNSIVYYKDIKHLSCTSKMPCYSFSLPALLTCPTGAKLRNLPNTPCFHCYGLKGRAAFPDVKSKKAVNYQLIQNLPLFIDTLTKEILATRCPLFRWQDCGDIISLAHLEAVNQICLNTPDVKHWLPTIETNIVKQFLGKYKQFASNLTVRLSSKRIDQTPAYECKYSSMVSRNEVKFNGKKYHFCDAYKWAGRCWSCTACWSFEGIIVYPLH